MRPEGSVGGGATKPCWPEPNASGLRVVEVGSDPITIVAGFVAAAARVAAGETVVCASEYRS